MAGSLITRLILYEAIRKNYPEVETNSASLHFIEATKLTLADLLGIDPDELSERGKVNFESEATNFCNKVASFMRKIKSKNNMLRQIKIRKNQRSQKMSLNLRSRDGNENLSIQIHLLSFRDPQLLTMRTKTTQKLLKFSVKSTKTQS